MTKELVKHDGPSIKQEVAISTVRAVIGVIPYVGPLLIEALFDCRSRIKQERANQFVEELKDAVQNLAESRIDYSFLKTEEFSDHIEEVMAKVLQNRSAAKRNHYKNILIKGIKGHRPPDLSKVFLDILSEITDEEMLLLAKFYELSNQQPDQPNPLSFKLNKERVEQLGYEYKDFSLWIQSLLRKGVLYDDGPGKWGARPYELIRITELGIRFYDYAALARP